MKKHLLYITAVLLGSMVSCVDDDSYKVEVPVADITLASPEEAENFDLNNMEIDEYTFSWNETIDGGTTLLLSANEFLLSPITFDTGNNKSHSIAVEVLDQIASATGAVGGNAGTVYWGVKPTKDLGIAAREIRSVNVRRLISRLLVPEDQKQIALDSDRPELPVSFTWDPEGEDPSTEYTITFSGKTDMSGEVINFPVGAVKVAGLTQSQLQEVFLKYSNHPFKGIRVYWNIQKKGSANYLSRTSSALDIDPMMIFRDVRGDEDITYKVAKISFRDGRVQYWLAENLRTTKYPDGTNIEDANIMFAPSPTFTDEQIKTYGGYYRPNPTMFTKLPSTGWRMPTIAECRDLYAEAQAQEGTYNVLRDPQFYNYESTQTDPKVNKWKLGLVTAGQQQGEDKAITNTGYSYIMATGIGEDNHRAAMLDHFAIWEVWAVGTNVRLIYNE
ncbi:SusE domain-containing protein [Bacteroides sp. 519]|uniref:SusE domain-containing protein n=1 Tax=Bacteroides sp. 519 TaxID=2302937 RepID=UPI0013D67004|nr:SusE domain-containing protein [Bacteroides sp. 519]NDV58716.1 hypothetical protein [Bacteroides sp. 519]